MTLEQNCRKCISYPDNCKNYKSRKYYQCSEYQEKMKDEKHKIINGKVCCINHCCHLHYYTEEEYNQEILLLRMEYKICKKCKGKGYIEARSKYGWGKHTCPECNKEIKKE